MVGEFSALTRARDERVAVFERNHTELVKFNTQADVDYRIVVSYLKTCLKEISNLGGKLVTTRRI